MYSTVICLLCLKKGCAYSFLNCHTLPYDRSKTPTFSECVKA